MAPSASVEVVGLDFSESAIRVANLERAELVAIPSIGESGVAPIRFVEGDATKPALLPYKAQDTSDTVSMHGPLLQNRLISEHPCGNQRRQDDRAGNFASV